MRIISPSFTLLLGAAICLPTIVHAQHNPNGQIIVTSLSDPYLVNDRRNQHEQVHTVRSPAANAAHLANTFQAAAVIARSRVFCLNDYLRPAPT
ncbi:MAG: hypothetical protein FJ276_16640 [Planctomycetes bacterium]|nr:hypothetical protein [Planctomycetota bacterium]